MSRPICAMVSAPMPVDVIDNVVRSLMRTENHGHPRCAHQSVQ